MIAKHILSIIERELETALNNIRTNNSNLDEEELIELADALSTYNHGNKTITKAFACEQILHCSDTTFDNYVKSGILPPGTRTLGSKELRWSKRDFRNIRLKRVRNNAHK